LLASQGDIVSYFLQLSFQKHWKIGYLISSLLAFLWLFISSYTFSAIFTNIVVPVFTDILFIIIWNILCYLDRRQNLQFCACMFTFELSTTDAYDIKTCINVNRSKICFVLSIFQGKFSFFSLSPLFINYSIVFFSLFSFSSFLFKAFFVVKSFFIYVFVVLESLFCSSSFLIYISVILEPLFCFSSFLIYIPVVFEPFSSLSSFCVSLSLAVFSLFI
jgi:hypothetical protein